jgi:hypothetical protein
VSRRALDFTSRAKHIGADLLNKDDIVKKLSGGMYVLHVCKVITAR